MFRLLFVMITFSLLGLGSGYFLWGTRVARLTESLSSLTLEIDTYRARLAAPREGESQGGVQTTDALRVITEGVAAMRTELADQKVIVEKIAASPGAQPVGESGNPIIELNRARHELAGCIADKQDLEARCRISQQRQQQQPYQQPQAEPAPDPRYTPPPPAYEPILPPQ